MSNRRSAARVLAALSLAAAAVLPPAPALADDDVAAAGPGAEGAGSTGAAEGAAAADGAGGAGAPTDPWLGDLAAWLVDLGDALPADPPLPGDPPVPGDPPLPAAPPVADDATRSAAHVQHCGHHTHLDVRHPHYRVEFLYHFGWRGRHYHRVLYHRQLLGLEDRVLTVRCAGEDTAAAARLSRWYGRG